MTYTVHLVDPHRAPFVVNPYSANGLRFPTLDTLESGASSANTSLLWYGKGSPNYGERVQENVLHLLEHFAGPTAPANPVAGQLWFDRRIFFHNSSAAANDGWYTWQDLPADPNGGTWARIPNGVAVMPTGTGAPVAAPTGGYDGIGGTGGKFQWYVDTATSTLYQGIFEAGHPLHQTWAVCGYMEAAGVPSAATIKPQQRLMVQTFGRSSQTDAALWSLANGVWASTVPPVEPTDGTLWYDTATQTLKVYNSSGSPTVGFEAVVGAFLPLGGGTMTGVIDMGLFRISNLGTPLVGTDAATKAYVDAAVIAGTGSLALDGLSDVEITSPLAGQFLKYVGGSPSPWVNAGLVLADLSDISATAVQVNYLVGVTSSVQTQLGNKLNLVGGTMSGALSMGNFKITSLGTPTLGTDATTKNYVDSADIVSGSFDGNTGTLTLNKGDASTISIPGFISASTLSYSPLPSELLGQLPQPVIPTNVDAALHAFDNVVRRRTSPRRVIDVGVGGSPPQLIYTTPRYEIDSHKLFVFVDGLKFIASQRGYQSVLFDTMVFGSPTGGPLQLSCDVDPELTGGLGSPQYDYDFDIVVDGGAPQTITLNGGTNETDTFCAVVDTINLQLVGAYAILEDQAITIYSNSVGAGSSIAITDGTVGSPQLPLFGSMLYFDAIDVAVPGSDYDYDEVGLPGELSTSIAFLAPVTGQTLEFIVLGQAGTTT